MVLALRKIRIKDWDYIMLLRNQAYDNFYQQNKPLIKKEHYTYLKKQKLNPKFFHWIIVKNDKDVGYVRLLNEDVSIIIDKKSQDKKIGTGALELLEIEAKKLGMKKLIALVLINNKKSEKIFVKNEYKLKQLWYEKELT